MKYLGLILICMDLMLGLCNSYLSMSEQQREELLFGRAVHVVPEVDPGLNLILTPRLLPG
jgi:hypothetical protein